jgi:phosphoglycerol transferase MdoB-like AlkP superfamily enzyme
MESNYTSAVAWLLGLVAIVFVALFRRRLQQWLAKHGVRRTGVSAGNAFLVIQTFMEPRVEYALRAQQEETTENDDTGEPPNPEDHPVLPRQPPR